MTREEAIEKLNNAKGCPLLYDSHIEALDMAISALEQEACDDAISRQAVLDGLKGCMCEDWVKTLFATMVKQLPSVTQKSGKWIEDEYGNVICSGCKRFRRDCRYGHTNYCNHCGAKMVEPQESEDK